MGTRPGARFNGGLGMPHSGNNSRKTTRHSREGGNPSPELYSLKQARLMAIAQVMDSRLRGNDGRFSVIAQYYTTHPNPTLIV